MGQFLYQFVHSRGDTALVQPHLGKKEIGQAFALIHNGLEQVLRFDGLLSVPTGQLHSLL